MSKEIRKAKKTKVGETVNIDATDPAEDNFDPFFTTERQALKMAIDDLEDLIKAIKSRVELVKIFHNEKSRGHDVFKHLTDENKTKVFGSVYSFDTDNLKDLGDDLTEADGRLQSILRRLV